MGTSLTGTKPKDTYDSLIKVGDNGPISGTAKYLSDGLGNDLPISVSTSNVGIGTSSPAQKLSVVGGSIFTSRNDSAENVIISDGTTNSSIQQVTHLYLNSGGNSATFGDIVFRTKNSFTEMGRFTQNGLCFNGDTAAANALDDYEEGTFTPTLNFNGASVGITYGTTDARYTKIGNVVYFSIRMTLTSKGSSTGGVRCAGLPFTVQNTGNSSDITSLSIGALQNITFNTFPMAIAIVNTNYLVLEEAVSGGAINPLTDADFQNDSIFRIAGFYYV